VNARHVNAHSQTAAIATESYSRLLAFLASRARNLSLAEDALSQAFLAALNTWPRHGVPDRPEAWLLTVARNKLRDGARRHNIRQSAVGDLLHQTAASIDQPGFTIPDQRLQLMFVCAHPAIDESARTPLMLQVVLGLDAARIAGAFLVSPTAMGQRLSRAKAKIAAAGIPFAIPEERELPARLQAVLEAVYGAYGLAWNGPGQLSHEAIWLARVAAGLMPASAETLALLSLLLHSEARRAARSHAVFTPLSEQDPTQWSAPLQNEAERLLTQASQLHQPLGPFQIEAAIQSAHAARRHLGVTPWREIAALYDRLVELRPSLGACVSRAAAHGQAFSPAAALAALDQTAAFKSRFAYQPYWACRAHWERQAGLSAADSYQRALALTSDAPLRRYLENQLLGE
jgi:predicted RNA polymerase sigma factor